MEEGKILQIYARIRNEDEIAQISKECERRGIAKSDFVLEAVELHLMNNKDLTPMIDARDKAERSLEASREIREGLEKDIVQLEADKALLTQTLAEANRAHDVQKKRHCDLSDHVESVQEELASVKGYRDDLKQQLSIAEDKFADVVDAFNKAELDLTKANHTNNELERQNGDLKVARQSNANQRDKFKQKLEEVVQTHERLVSEVRAMQSRGVFARASKLKRFNTAKYVIKTEEDNETSA